MGKYASEMLKQAEAWLGKNEKDGSFKEIIDIYNSHKPLARGYKMKYTDAWCACFVSAVSIKLGYTDIIPTEVGCGKFIELFKKLGVWVENENRTPNVGDIVFYDWEDNGVGDNTGGANHTGIVQKVKDGIIYVIEGNYDNSVKVRKIKLNGKYLRGFAVPRYDKEEQEIKNVSTKLKYKVGDKVIFNGTLYKDSKGNGAGQTRKNLESTIYLVKEGAKCPYNINNGLGWVKESDLSVISKKYIKLKTGVWCRKGIGFKYDKYKVIPKGTKCELLEKNAGTSNGYKWDKVKWNNTIVYLPNKWNTYL